MKRWPWLGIGLLIAIGFPWLSAFREHRKAFAVDSRAELCEFLETQVPADAMLVADDAAELYGRVAAAGACREQDDARMRIRETAIRQCYVLGGLPGPVDCLWPHRVARRG